MSKLTNAEYAEGLRAIADWFEAHPEIPTPWNADQLSLYARDKAEIVAIAKAMGHADKSVNDHFYSVARSFGGIKLEAFTDRVEVCTRRQVGTKHVEEKITPAHDEPVYEYDCPDSLLGASDNTKTA